MAKNDNPAEPIPPAKDSQTQLPIPPRTIQIKVREASRPPPFHYCQFVLTPAEVHSVEQQHMNAPIGVLEVIRNTDSYRKNVSIFATISHEISHGTLGSSPETVIQLEVTPFSNKIEEMMKTVRQDLEEVRGLTQGLVDAAAPSILGTLLNVFLQNQFSYSGFLRDRKSLIAGISKENLAMKLGVPVLLAPIEFFEAYFRGSGTNAAHITASLRMAALVVHKFPTPKNGGKLEPMEERHFSALLSAVFKVEAGMEPWLYYQSGNDRNISCIPRKSNTPKKNLERNPQAGAQMSTLSRKSKTDRRILNKGRLLKSFPKKRDSPVEKTDMKTDERGESSVWPGSKNQSSSPARKRSPQKPKDTRKRKGNKQHRGIKNTKTNNSSVVT